MNLKTINKKVSLGIFSLMLALGLFSCNTELLDPKPKTSFFDLVVFDTPNRIELQANGMYTTVKNGNFLGGRYQVYGDVRSEDFINRTNNGITAYPVWNHTLTETDQNATINTWNQAYLAINQINVFLKGLEDNKSKYVVPTFPATFATTGVANYSGEARFLRALCYYQLLQLYARPYADGAGSKPGLPLRLSGEKDATNNDLARSTVGEVYTQILADLDFAEANLPVDWAANTLNTQPTLRATRAHKNSAIALKTRVYLSMGNYAKVISEGDKIVTAGTGPFSANVGTGVPNALAADVVTLFTTSPQTNLEWIFNLPFTVANAPGTQNQLGSYFNASTNSQGGSGEFSLNNAGIIGNTTDWIGTDDRRKFNVAAAASGGAFFLRKYQAPSPYTDSAPVIRYAEVLLNLAEARARTAGVDARAIALLNAVRFRSDKVSAAFTAASFTDGTALANRILLEKRIEFLGEGLRNADIMRLLVPIPGKASVPAILPTDSKYIFPIPSSELSGNTLMTRN